VPKVTQEHLESRRAQILEAAIRVFGQYGYDGATVARLEEATGLSRGAIYHYFDDKKDLFAAIAADVNRRYIEAITGGGFAEAIHKMAQENPELLRVLLEKDMRFQNDDDFTRRLEASSAELRSRLEAWFHEQRDSGALRTDLDWRDTARFVLIVINGLALHIAGDNAINPETVARLLEDSLRPQAAERGGSRR
jgi:TetR/AcrR family transcriptional regulator, transcriptional repressor of aconitase